MFADLAKLFLSPSVGRSGALILEVAIYGLFVVVAQRVVHAEAQESAAVAAQDGSSGRTTDMLQVLVGRSVAVTGLFARYGSNRRP